jgi:peptidoglycan hydrolase-like protein with peptidoglycan-binding domain
MPKRVLSALVAIALVGAGAAGATVGVRYWPGRSAQAAGSIATGTAQVRRTDLTSRQFVSGTLGYGDSYSVAASGPPSTTLAGTTGSGSNLVTWLPAPGDVVQRGAALYRVGDRPVPVLYGSVPLFRQLTSGVHGDDVKEVEQNLLTLGFGAGTGLVADGVFTGADAWAVRKWQASLGLTQTGIVSVGDALVEPGALRVSVLHASLGAPLAGPILDATSTTRVVLVQLDTYLQLNAKVGDSVTVTVPGTTQPVPGRVSDVGRVATQPSNQGGGQGQGPVHATVSVTVTLDNAAQVTGSLDQAPVRVAIADASRHAVLAVPVEALVAISAGRYAVTAIEDGRRTTIPVTTGLFGDSGLVEVSGRGLFDGLAVQVPRQP